MDMWKYRNLIVLCSSPFLIIAVCVEPEPLNTWGPVLFSGSKNFTSIIIIIIIIIIIFNTES